MCRVCEECGLDVSEVLSDVVYTCADGCGAVVCEECYDNSDGSCPLCGGVMVLDDEEE